MDRTNASREATSPPSEGIQRVWILDVAPQVDGGQFPAKRTLGDRVEVRCDLVADGHDLLAGELRFRSSAEAPWEVCPLAKQISGLFAGNFAAQQLGLYEFQIEAWVDVYGSWRAATEKRVEAGQDVAQALLSGAELLKGAAERAKGQPRALLREAAGRLAGVAVAPLERWRGLPPAIDELAREHADRRQAACSKIYELQIDPVLARFSSWYELFPRSAGAPGRHGRFADVETLLPELQDMGFDVLYLPPIHPIGRTARKGRNNSERAAADDPGSPWAIGAAEGGHDAVHPELGTLEDFRRLVAATRAHGMALALDIAFQASPDHPWVKAHPSWFRHRPDGSIQYAENPPKRYQDVYPFDFESVDWKELWQALRDLFLFWVDQGVTVFRVDNPHTKPLPFWRWCLSEVRRRCPEAVFLAEAFTRPGPMYALAKLGFSQSYTYFTWRQTSRELGSYLRELTQPPLSDFFRPNFWPNTPDILPETLQFAGRPAFLARLVLAATMSSNFGIYGPVFELQENQPRPGSEEYLDSEKYQLRSFDRGSPTSLQPVVRQLNRIRRAHPALQRNEGAALHLCDNPQLFAFSKRAPLQPSSSAEASAADDAILVVVNLDPRNPQSGRLDLDLESLGVEGNQPFLAHDQLSDQRYLWTGGRQTLTLDPAGLPAAILHIRHHRRTEREFDYFA